jgi:ubiquinone/menaquinone biosynthesis C-methylase UbiE/DNA-binding transcriptional ArsR family regulator
MPGLTATTDLLHVFGDPTRVRLLALLARHELTVAELTSILEVAQSRVSTHLGRLREAGLLRDRRNGASTLYALNDAAMPAPARTLWTLLERQVEDAMLESDARRCEALLRARDRSAVWPDAVAGQMDRHYSPGRTWEATARAFLGLVRLGDVLDGGSGDGAVAELVAPRVRSLTCLDRSPRVLAAAQARLERAPNVRYLLGELEAIPAAGRSFDHVLLFNVLASARQPARAIAEAARVLRPGGGVTLVTLAEHPHGDQTVRYGHVNPGFKPTTIKRWLTQAGFRVETCAVTSRERRQPHFEVLTAFAHMPSQERSP